MFRPQREKLCPMCTSFRGTWEEKLPDVEQRVSSVFVARSPIARLIEAKKARGCTRHKVYSDVSGDYTRDYVSAADADVPGYNVFTRREGAIRHFWGSEMGGATADPGQDPRDAPDFDPLVDPARHHAGRPRRGLVSETRLLTAKRAGTPHHYGTISGEVSGISPCLTRACV
jgi:predicted dithiol-disulfide oxidoreductase (DUF899 family)